MVCRKWKVHLNCTSAKNSVKSFGLNWPFTLKNLIPGFSNILYCSKWLTNFQIFNEIIMSYSCMLLFQLINNSIKHVWSYSITFLNSLFINSVCAHTVFERSTYKEWHNPSGNSSDGWGDSLEQSCLGVVNSKNQNSPSTINNHLLFNVQTVYSSTRERESVKVYEQTQRDAPRLSPTELSECELLTGNWLANWLLFQNLLFFIYLNSGY